MTIPDKAVIAIVEQYQDDAEDYAKRMAWRFAKAGDHETAAYWRRVSQAIIDLMHEKKAA